MGGTGELPGSCPLPYGPPPVEGIGSSDYCFVVERSYYFPAIKAYNMTRYVVESLKIDSAVVGTAMTYWHMFVSVHGLRKVDEIVLSASCTFLASKVEHYKVRLKQIVSLVFEVDLVGEAMDGWRRMLLETELLLCHTLCFKFQVIHPVNRIAELVPDGNRTVLDCAHRLFLLSFVTPLCTRATPEEIVEALVYLAADGANHLGVCGACLNTKSPERRDGIINVMLDALAVMRKDTKLPKIDSLIVARRKRFRELDSVRQSVAYSSAGMGSVDHTPCAPSVE